MSMFGNSIGIFHSDRLYFDVFTLKIDFQKLSSDFDKLPTDSNFNFENTEQYIDQLNAIKEIESQLRFYKKFLLSQPDVKERLQKKKSTN